MHLKSQTWQVIVNASINITRRFQEKTQKLQDDVKDRAENLDVIKLSSTEGKAIPNQWDRTDCPRQIEVVC